jgi:putative chitinase
MITLDLLSAAFPKTNKDLLNTYLPHLFVLTNLNDIDTKLRVAHFLAQTGHESGEFKFVRENLNYSAEGLLKTFPKYFDASTAKLYQRNPEKIANRVYANRMGNGAEQSGDGWKYRGRGLIQITGKNNYVQFSTDVKRPLNEVLVYLDTPRGCVHSATWYWNKNHLNNLADKNDIKGLTKSINGGYNGLKHREELFNRIYKLL